MGKGMGRTSSPKLLYLIGIGILVATGLVGLTGCQKTDGILDPAGGDASSVLHAAYRSDAAFEDNPIVLDGQAIDTEWGGVGTGSTYINVRVSADQGSGVAKPPAYVAMKAVYTDRDLFLLVRWTDTNPDEAKDAMFYRGETLDSLGGGCQPSLVDPVNWIRNPGGAYDEDRVTLAFEADSAGNSIGPFSQYGCLTACHVNEQPAFGRVGYGRLEVWQWLASRTNLIRDLYDRRESAGDPLHGIPGYLDDLYSDMTGGLQADPGAAGYRANFTAGSDVPTWFYREVDDPFARPQNPATCFNEFGENPCRKNNGLVLTSIWREKPEVHVPAISECDTMNFAPLPLGTEPRTWRRGDRVPGWILTYPNGSRADVHGKAQYAEGVWTLEIGRRLDTGDPLHDVIFQPASGRKYVFTLAVMDNSQAEHLGSEPQTLTFDPKGGVR
jgi:hypothetical protein